MLPGVASSAVVFAPTLSYVTSSVNNTAAGSYTFNNISVTGSGILIIGVHSEGGTTASTPTMTVNGNAATLVVGSSTTGSNTARYHAAIFRYEGTLGSTANIVVTYATSNASRCGISTWRLDSYTSTTPVFTGVNYGTSGSTSRTINVGNQPTGAIGLGIQTNHGGETVTVSNTGNPGTNTVSQYNTNVGSGGSTFVGLKLGALTQYATYNITTTFPSSVDDSFLAAAVWV